MNQMESPCFSPDRAVSYQDQVQKRCKVARLYPTQTQNGQVPGQAVSYQGPELPCPTIEVEHRVQHGHNQSTETWLHHMATPMSSQKK